MKVRQLKSNQFVINHSSGQFNCGTNHASGETFQSYDSLIAFKDYQGKIYLDRTYWDYSRTTSKYRNQFTGLDTNETKNQIKSGKIQLVDMN